MSFRQVFSRWASFILVLILLLIAVYCGVNAYYYTTPAAANGIGVAAWSAFGSLFLVAAIFITVSQGISMMNEHLEHISANSDEQIKLLRYMAKQKSGALGS